MRCEFLTQLLTVIALLYSSSHGSAPIAKNSSFSSFSLPSSPSFCKLNTLDSIYIVRSLYNLKLQPGLTSTFHGIVLKMFALYNILLSGDIELNPGPSRSYKYPCGVCSNPVKVNQKGICCDVCNTWLHIRCIGILDGEYCDLQALDDLWCCKRCAAEALPFADTSSDSIFNTSMRQSTPKPPTQPMTISKTNTPSLLYSNRRSLPHKMDKLRTMAHTTNHISSASVKPGWMILLMTMNCSSLAFQSFAGIGTDTVVALPSSYMNLSLSNLAHSSSDRTPSC